MNVPAPSLLPPPGLLLGQTQTQFPSWREGQSQSMSSILDWLAGNSHYLGASLPTGSGKSLLAVLASRLGSRRTVILTATKGLQSQLMSDFQAVGLFDMRGQANYQCLEFGGLVDDAPCHDGVDCPLRKRGCLYYDDLQLAVQSPMVVTNYAYYIHQTQYSSGLGTVKLLVCDEAHLAFQALESIFTVHLDQVELLRNGLESPPDSDMQWSDWQQWARRQHLSVGAGKAHRSLERSLKVLSMATGEYVIQPDASGWTLTPVWVSEYGRLLNAGKVLYLSAVISPKTLQLLGVKNHLWLDGASYFPPERSPVTHVRTVRVTHKSTPDEMLAWVSRIDQIISHRLDRKGIVFTVSYERARFLLAHSQHRAIMLDHDHNTTARAVARFRFDSPPCVLVTPSVTTGYDFPGDQCRYIVVGKLPYPDTSSPITKRRMELDSDWVPYLAMQTLVQECGRGSRSADDWCEVLVIDDQWRWWWPKYHHLAPGWFQARYRGSQDVIPPPLSVSK